MPDECAFNLKPMAQSPKRHRVIQPCDHRGIPDPPTARLRHLPFRGSHPQYGHAQDEIPIPASVPGFDGELETALESGVARVGYAAVLADSKLE